MTSTILGFAITGRGLERGLRLWTGLVLFAYVIMHFLNHALGIRSIEAMRAGTPYLLEPWQTLPGLIVLYGAMLPHLGLGLYALYRRRHLRIPAIETVQLVLGLAIPLLLISHAAAVRVGESVYDLPIGYERIIYQYWVVLPDYGLPRQFALLAIVWIHGCIGVRNWLKPKPWYSRWVPVLASLATLLPVLAALGFLNAGLDVRELAATDPAAIPAQAMDTPGTVQAEEFASVYRIVDAITLAYVGILAGVFVLRAGRDWHAQRYRAVRITYPGRRTISVPEGFSVLEASRWAGIPHASVCGGRGRCSTCRVDVVAGLDTLPEPAPEEQRLLDRIGAPAGVRLACQIRPERDISVVPLVHSAGEALTGARTFALTAGGRRETEVAALFIDLRQSTRLADDRLPYDTLFIVERYINVVRAAARECGGHVITVAGDGVMSVFGAEGSPRDGATDAFRAALQIWDGIDALNEELRDELGEPLRFGIGLHVGVAVVGLKWEGGADGTPFLGDTGNVAARLEGEAKRSDYTMVASREAMSLIAEDDLSPVYSTVSIAGKQEPMSVAHFRQSVELRRLLRRHADV